MDQCAAVTAHIEHNHAQKSPDLHALDRQIETQKLINRFDADPTLTRLQLLRTHEGTLHLARRWRTLTHPEALPATPQAIEETLTLIANLLGIHPDHRPSQPPAQQTPKPLRPRHPPRRPPDDRANPPTAASAPSPDTTPNNSATTPTPTSNPSPTSNSPASPPASPSP